MSKTIKKTREQMKEKGVNESGSSFLRLGIKKDGGGVESTGFHKVQLVKEPEITKKVHYHSGKEYQVVLFTLKENGKELVWDVPLYKMDKGLVVKDEDGNPTEYYLLPNLEPIDVGEFFGLEMKKKGIKNFIEVTYPLNDDTPISDDEEEIDIDTLEVPEDEDEIF
jgi:hypothetical protein